MIVVANGTRRMIARRVLRMAGLLVLLPLLSLLFVGVHVVSAQEISVNVDGITLRCEQCRKINDKICKIKFGRDAKVMTCEEVLDMILRERIKDTAVRNKYPLISSELLAYLLDEPRSSSVGTLVLQNLLLTKEGENLLLGSFGAIYSRYSSSVASALDSHASGELCNSLWLRQIGQTEVELLQSLPILINACGDNLRSRLKSVLIELPNDSASKVLDSAIVLLATIDRGLSAECGELRTLMATCVGDEIDQVVKCRRDSKSFVNKEFREYAETIASHLTVSAVHSWSPCEALSELAEVGYRYRSSKAVFDEVYYQVQKLRELPTSHAALSTVFRDRHVTELLDGLAREGYGTLSGEMNFGEKVPSAKRLQEMIGLLYIDLGRHARKQGDDKATIDAFVNSLRYLPVFNELRDEELFALYSRTNDEALKSQIATLLESSPRALKSWLRLGSLLALAIIVCIGFWQLRTGKIGIDGDKHRSDALSSDIRQQLREDLQFFGLNPFATEETLAHEFRKRAKESHPDLTNEESDDFREIKLRYERALKILRSRNDE